MDTMKILLGATIALLLAALVMSWNGMRDGVKNAPEEEIARMRKQLDELRVETERIQLEKQLQQLRESTPPPAPAPAGPSSAEMEAMRLELAAKEAALREAELEKERAERDAEAYKDEAGIVGRTVLEQSDNELRRARLIGNALLMGRITEYLDDSELGGFATFEVLMPENVRVGDTLAIRRNTGILGLLKVSDITPEGGIANPMPGFGPVKPQPGDELILPPD
jgi:hypothetical protein